ncbi:MAG: VWA domain-containing protein [bacterium]|nr:VWA domain-containing protein [bacterium]
MRGRSSVCRLIATCLVAFLISPPPGVSQVFRESTSVVAVEVPVHVIRGGKPVRGLTRDDFILLDERKQQEITGFEVIDLATVVAPGTAGAATTEGAPAPGASPVRLPVSARRHFLLLFDLSFSRPDSVVNARQAALDLVRDGLHPSDLVSVATYAHGRGPRLLHGFTSDRPQTEAAIQSLGLTQLIEPLRDPLGLVFGDLDGAARAFGLGSTGPGRGGSRQGYFAAAMMEFARRAEAQQQRQDRVRVTALTRSLADLAKLMDSARGRKHVVYLSEGFDTTPLFGTADQERLDQMSASAEEGRVWEIDSEERYGDTRSQNQLEEMFAAFRRADCTIQAVDIGGMQRIADVESGSQRSTERTRTKLAGRHDSLAIMASATGGEFYRHFNNLTEAMSEVLDNTSVTYLLSFEPRKLKLDGSYHRVKVKLKGGVAGRLVHRPGYYEPLPFGELGDSERQLRTAELIVGGLDGGAIDTAVIASPFAASGGRAYVPVFLEIDGLSLSAAVPGDSLNADIYAYALDGDGRVRDFLGHSMTVDMGQVRPMLERGGMKFYGHFDLPAGQYTLRVLVRDRQGGLYGLSTFDLRVPDFAEAEPAALPPFFVEAPGKWMMAREELAEGEELPAFPFMADGQPFLPAARPALRRGESVDVHLMAYHLGERPEVTGLVRNELGAELKEPAVAFTEAAPGPADMATASASFDTGLLDDGVYTLEVTVRDPATGKQASSSGPFVVANSRR